MKKKKTTKKSTGVKATKKVVPSSAAVMMEKAAKTTVVKSGDEGTTPFGMLVLAFVAFFILHAVVISVASWLFPSMVVLGNEMITPFFAVIYSMLVFTFITVGAMPIIEAYQSTQTKKLTTMEWMVIYFILNFVGLWVIARFAADLGMGLSSWVVVAVLAAILDFAQGGVWMLMTSKK